MSIPQLTFTIPQIKILSEDIQGMSGSVKFFIFLLAELANAYFFGSLTAWRENLTDSDRISRSNSVLLFLLFGIFSAFISFIFLKITIFSNDVSGWGQILIFFILYLISYIMSFAFIASALDDTEKTQSNALFFALVYILFFLTIIIN